MNVPYHLLVALLASTFCHHQCLAQTINLGACSEFAVMAGSTDVCSGAATCNVVNGYLGVSPGTSITGNWHTDSSYATKQVTSTKSIACATQGLAAWNHGKSLPTGKKLVSGEIGGKTFYHGVHNFPGTITISTASAIVYLDALGHPNSMFFFYTPTTLTTAANTKVLFKNGAQAKNVYWVLGTAATLGDHSVFGGTILAGSAITMGTGAQIYGRAIAQTAVTCATACTITKS